MTTPAIFNAKRQDSLRVRKSYAWTRTGLPRARACATASSAEQTIFDISKDAQDPMKLVKTTIGFHTEQVVGNLALVTLRCRDPIDELVRLEFHESNSFSGVKLLLGNRTAVARHVHVDLPIHFRDRLIRSERFPVVRFHSGLLQQFTSHGREHILSFLLPPAKQR